MPILPDKEPAHQLVQELKRIGWPRDDGRMENQICTYRQVASGTGKRFVWSALIVGALVVVYYFFS